MGLVTSTEMFKKAYEGHYAIGAFNVNNMEIIQGITEAATMEKAPVILQVSKGARAYAKHVYLVKLVEAALLDAQESGVDLPIVLHLDHGPDFETCKACIDGGFTSVMIDGSHLPFEENIKLTRQVVEYAHDHGVVVEGELGRLAGVEDDVKVGDDDALYTDPDEVELTLWRLPSAPATARSSSRASRTCALTFWRKFPRSCRASRLCFMVRPPLCRSMCR